jgi:hypothetical protein
MLAAQLCGACQDAWRFLRRHSQMTYQALACVWYVRVIRHHLLVLGATSRVLLLLLRLVKDYVADQPRTKVTTGLERVRQRQMASV